MTSVRWEQYVETIDGIQKAKGYAKVRDVAKHLEVGLPTVTEMFQKLSEAGLVNYEKYSGVTLTSEGQAMANELEKKHETLKDFLSILGVPEAAADSDACIMEHSISAETLDRLRRFVDFVNIPDQGPVWLLHFREFYKTGVTPVCARDCLRSCLRDSERILERVKRDEDPGD